MLVIILVSRLNWCMLIFRCVGLVVYGLVEIDLKEFIIDGLWKIIVLIGGLF